MTKKKSLLEEEEEEYRANTLAWYKQWLRFKLFCNYNKN